MTLQKQQQELIEKLDRLSDLYLKKMFIIGKLLEKKAEFMKNEKSQKRLKEWKYTKTGIREQKLRLQVKALEKKIDATKTILNSYGKYSN